MDKMIAFCGSDCIKCEAFIATQANDRESLERTAEKWREQYFSDITAESIICDGCMSNGRLTDYCYGCSIRLCGSERGIENCAYCSDYDTCGKLAALYEYPGFEIAKATLDNFHSAMQIIK